MNPAAAILLAIAEILNATTKLTIAITSTQTPAQQAEGWKRYYDQTEWMYKLLAKFSDKIEKLIEAGMATPKPPV